MPTLPSETTEYQGRICRTKERMVARGVKMENPVLAPFSGTVKEICLAVGDSIACGDIICAIVGASQTQGLATNSQSR